MFVWEQQQGLSLDPEYKVGRHMTSLVVEKTQEEVSRLLDSPGLVREEMEKVIDVVESEYSYLKEIEVLYEFFPEATGSFEKDKSWIVQKMVDKHRNF